MEQGNVTGHRHADQTQRQQNEDLVEQLLEVLGLVGIDETQTALVQDEEEGPGHHMAVGCLQNRTDVGTHVAQERVGGHAHEQQG